MNLTANKMTMFFVYIYLIILTVEQISSANDTTCSASENLKWNKIKQKCVQCPDCPPGSFRNLTEPYTRRTGPHGAERCIRCRPCQDGTYSRGGHGECAKCVVNCTELDREFAGRCTRVHDATCGSCLNGFDDIFGNTQFPCAPPKVQKSLRLLEPQRPSNKPKQTGGKSSNQEVERQSDESSSVKNKMGNEMNVPSVMQRSKSEMKDQTSQKSGFGVPTILAVGVAGCLTVAIAIGLVVYKVYNKTERRTTTNVESVTQGSYKRVNVLSCDNDIEMDTFAQTDETGTKQYFQRPQPDTTDVRTELDLSAQLCLPSHPRAELSQMSPTDNFDGKVYFQLPGGPSDGFCYKRNKDICRCRVEKQCQCQTFDFPENVYVDKSDKYVMEVANCVCHDPFPLFYNLGLEDSIIYQENNSRDRDPELISQSELVLNLLHRWIERQSTPALLKQLSVALCKADFHSINNKIYNMYLESNSPH